MKFQKLFVAIAAVAFVGTFSQIASAQFGNPLKRLGNSVRKEAGNAANSIKKAGGRINNSVRTEAGRAANSIKRAHNLNYKVTVFNNSTYFIPYNFNGKSQIGLMSKRDNKIKGMTFTGTGATPTITFKNNKGQSKKYKLRNGSYEFKLDRNGVLNLFKR